MKPYIGFNYSEHLLFVSTNNMFHKRSQIKPGLGHNITATT